MKHIESIQPELAADDITRLLADDDATATAALTRLLHDVTGCDIPQTSDLPESEVEELVPLCVSILRRHWQTPLTCLGDGITPMSLADLFRQAIGDRVQGNEALGIPSANANIPAALTALRERHIADGLTLTLTDGTTTQAPDGLSLAQLLCTTLADTITELKDDNVGWTMSKALSNLFPNLADVELGCGLITSQIANNLPYKKMIFRELKEVQYNPKGYNGVIIVMPNLEEMHFPELVKAEMGGLGYLFRDCPKMLTISFPKLEYISACNESCFKSATLKEIYMPSLKTIKRHNWGSFLNTVPALEKLVLGDTEVNGRTGTGADFVGCTELIHIEFAQGMGYTTNLSSWNPTTALAERLDEFLSNFKTYIAHRLTSEGSGLTLTLSQAVRDAIQTDPEIVSIITSKGWTISPAPSV